jgi:hypothetical protein
MKQHEIEKAIRDIDAEVKKETGIDLEYVVRGIRRIFRGWDLSSVVVGEDVFLVKGRNKDVVH